MPQPSPTPVAIVTATVCEEATAFFPLFFPRVWFLLVKAVRRLLPSCL